MSFVHPGIAIATVGLALVPLVIHLINRRRHRRQPWAAMIFLLKAHRRSQRRMRLESWLLLALRTLVIVLIGLTIARPYFRSKALGVVLEAPRHDRAIIVDDSLSMQARRADGTRAFDAARAVAKRLIEQAATGDSLAVLTAARPAKAWMDRPVRDRTAVGRIVESLRCTARMADRRGAVERASALLGRGDAVDGARVAYVITDLTRSSIGPAGLLSAASVQGAGGGTSNIDRLFFINVGPEMRANVSLAGLRCEGQILGWRVPLGLTFDVENHGDSAARGLRVALRLDDHLVRTVELEPLEPNQKRTDGCEIVLPTPGPHRITATLTSATGDVLDADDRCHLAVHVASRISVLLLEEDAGSEPARRPLFYYRAALAADSGQGDSGLFQTRTIRPGDLDGEVLGDCDLVVLGDVPRLSEQTWKRLRRYVESGGGVMMFLGDGVRPENYRRAGGRRPAKERLLPVLLDGLVDHLDSEPAVGFTISDAGHPILADFAGHDRGGLLLARVRRYRRIAENPPSVGADPTLRTVLSFSSGGPALLSKRLGRGRVLIWLVGPDMNASNLPAKPDFLPLMLNASLFAARDEGGGHNVFVGDTLLQPIGAENAQRPVTVVLPDGRATLVPPEPLGGAPAVRFAVTDQPGIYRVESGDTAALFSVNVRTANSDLRMVDEAALKEAFGPQAAVIARAEKTMTVAAPPREFAGLAMFLLLGVVVLETAAASLVGVRG